MSKYQLSSCDPEDISDVLLKVEKSFDFRFGDTELKNVKTFGELCDIVVNKIEGDNLNDCTTQQAFYKVRDALAETLSIDKSKIVPATALQELLPKHKRRQLMSQVDKLLRCKVDILQPKGWITMTLIVAILTSLAGLFIFWKIALAILVISILGIRLADKSGIELNLETVGQLAEKISREHYRQVRRNKNTVNRSEIVSKVKDLFIHDLMLKESELVREAGFE